MTILYHILYLLLVSFGVYTIQRIPTEVYYNFKKFYNGKISNKYINLISKYKLSQTELNVYSNKLFNKDVGYINHKEWEELYHFIEENHV